MSKTETETPEMAGTIRRILLPRGFAFVLGDDGVEYFLHASEFPDTGMWNGDVLHEGIRVRFTPKRTQTGWRATEANLC